MYKLLFFELDQKKFTLNMKKAAVNAPEINVIGYVSDLSDKILDFYVP